MCRDGHVPAVPRDPRAPVQCLCTSYRLSLVCSMGVTRLRCRRAAPRRHAAVPPCRTVTCRRDRHRHRRRRSRLGQKAVPSASRAEARGDMSGDLSGSVCFYRRVEQPMYPCDPHPRDSQETSWRSHGDGVEMAWISHGDGAEMTWRWRGDLMEMAWRWRGDGVEISWRWRGDLMEMA